MKISIERFPINHSFFPVLSCRYSYIYDTILPPRLLRRCIHLKLIKKSTGSIHVEKVLEIKRDGCRDKWLQLLFRYRHRYFFVSFFVTLFSSQRYIDIDVCITMYLCLCACDAFRTEMTWYRVLYCVLCPFDLIVNRKLWRVLRFSYANKENMRVPK